MTKKKKEFPKKEQPITRADDYSIPRSRRLKRQCIHLRYKPISTHRAKHSVGAANL